MKSKKLFIVVNADWFFLSHRLPIALEAMNKGYQVTLFSVNTGKRNEVESYGIRFVELHFHRSKINLFKEIRSLIILCNKYFREKPDIIHHVGLRTIITGSIASHITYSKNVVNAFSGLGSSFIDNKMNFKKRLIILALRFLLKNNNYKNIFQNSDDESFIRRILNLNPARNYLIRGSGIDLNKFSYLIEPLNSTVKFVFAARLLKDKGLIEFCNAAKIIHTKYPRIAEFHIYGMIDTMNVSGISKEELEKLIAQTPIIYHGHSDNIKEVYAKSNVIVLPSYREGLPKSLIEACAIGRAIITTDTEGCREVVDHKVNGLLVPVKNSEKLAEAMICLLFDEKKRIAMGKEGRKKAELEFDINSVVEKHLEIYSSFIL